MTSPEHISDILNYCRDGTSSIWATYEQWFKGKSIIFGIFFGFSSIFFDRVIVWTQNFFFRVEHRMGDILNIHVMGVWPTKNFFWAFEKKFWAHFCFFFIPIRARWGTNISGSDLQKIRFFYVWCNISRSTDPMTKLFISKWRSELALSLKHVYGEVVKSYGPLGGLEMKAFLWKIL